MGSVDRRVWFTSDTHFGHENIIEYCRPQFSNLKEMEDCLITNWRETVAPEDLVYHLGDFAWKTADAVRVRPQLTGTIRLIVGNHDDIPGLVEAKLFQRVQMWRAFPEWGFVATHVPIPLSQVHKHCFTNIHGHVHGNLDGLFVFHRDLSVESTDFRPVESTVLQEWSELYSGRRVRISE